MRKTKQELGQWGERLAALFLTKNGYAILAKNYRTRYGEIDIIAQKARVTIFVEVKTRTSQSFGYPEAAITPKKQQHLIAAALNYLQENPNHDQNWQIDVIAIRQRDHRQPEIVHIENAVTG